MAVELLGNLGESTLSAAITSTSATTLTVTSATPFPAAVAGTSQFRVIVDSEIMIVTNVSGTTFTVTRGAEGTTAATHASGAPITHVITAAVLAAIGVPAGAGGAGKVLTSGTADYAQAWGDPNWGGGDYFESGQYSHGLFMNSMTTFSLTLSRLYLVPFIVPIRRSFDRIGANVTTAAGAASGAVLRMGIYLPGAGKPGALLVDAGTVSSESTTGTKELTISVTLDPGVYWRAIVAQTVTCTVAAYSANLATPWASVGSSVPTAASAAFYQQNSVTGALPSTLTPTLGGTAFPTCLLRAA